MAETIDTASAGRWQVRASDGEVFVVDVDARRLEVADGAIWALSSVDDCAVGCRGAFTVLDGSGTAAPWFTAEVVSVVRLLR